MGTSKDVLHWRIDELEAKIAKIKYLVGEESKRLRKSQYMLSNSLAQAYDDVLKIIEKVEAEDESIN